MDTIALLTIGFLAGLTLTGVAGAWMFRRFVDGLVGDK